MKTVIPDIRIESVIAWMPEEILELSSLSTLFGEEEIQSITKATGVKRVRIADKDITSSDMCFNAAEALFKASDTDRAEIDGLVFVSQTTDHILPATSISLQHRLGLSTDTVCIDIHYGCSGYIYGLMQAAMWISCGACKKVLVLAGDTTTKMINPRDKSLRMVFGDCGTATIVTSGGTDMGFYVHSDGSGADRLIVPAGGFRLPKSEETGVLVYDEDKNGRTKDDLYMDGFAIFNFAISNVHKNVNELILDMGWDKGEVGLYAMHQANRFMVNYIRKKLAVDKGLVPVNIENWGNTGPATIPLLLSDLLSDDHQYDLNKVIMSGFGVGLSWGSVATSLKDTKFYTPINK